VRFPPGRAKLATIPVATISSLRVVTTMDLKTAKALGLTIPMLVRADQIIE
jgi:hypothetical protein